MTKTKEEYIGDYLDHAKKTGFSIELPAQQIAKTAEAAWVVDSYIVEPGDEPSEKSPPRRTR